MSTIPKDIPFPGGNGQDLLGPEVFHNRDINIINSPMLFPALRRKKAEWQRLYTQDHSSFVRPQQKMVGGSRCEPKPYVQAIPNLRSLTPIP